MALLEILCILAGIICLIIGITHSLLALIIIGTILMAFGGVFIIFIDGDGDFF